MCLPASAVRVCACRSYVRVCKSAAHTRAERIQGHLAAAIVPEDKGLHKPLAACTKGRCRTVLQDRTAGPYCRTVLGLIPDRYPSENQAQAQWCFLEHRAPARPISSKMINSQLMLGAKQHLPIAHLGGVRPPHPRPSWRPGCHGPGTGWSQRRAAAAPQRHACMHNHTARTHTHSVSDAH